MNERAREFCAAMTRWLDACGSGVVRSVSVQRVGTWTVIKVGATSDETARLIAAEMGLTQARTPQKGRVWWREYVATTEGATILVAGPTHSFEEPEDWPGRRVGTFPS